MARVSDIFSYNDETGLVNGNNTSVTNVLTIIPVDEGGGGGGIRIVDTPSFDGYTIRVSSNETNATILVNGVSTQKTTPQNITVTNTQLLTGDVEITTQKEGFGTLEKYVLSLSLPENSIAINNSRFDRPLGISSATLNVQYFIGNSEQQFPATKINGNFVFLDFTLNPVRINPINSDLATLDIFLGGVSNSVLINKNGQVDLYPQVGITNYNDAVGTLFSIKSSDVTLYRITEIIVESDGESSNTLTANSDESLSINLTLNKNYVLKIQTEQLQQQLPGLDPKIELLNSDPRTYNINSKAGVPIVFKKNSDVKAVTVVVGQNVFEFDSLDEGDVAGITIPYNAFVGLGQYSVRIYPFSLKDYENQVRPTPQPVVVKQNVKNIKTPKLEISEVVEVPIPKTFISPYELPVLDVIPTTPVIPVLSNVVNTPSLVPTNVASTSQPRGGGGAATIIDTNIYGTSGVARVEERINRVAIQ